MTNCRGRVTIVLKNMALLQSLTLGYLWLKHVVSKCCSINFTMKNRVKGSLYRASVFKKDTGWSRIKPLLHAPDLGLICFLKQLQHCLSS